MVPLTLDNLIGNDGNWMISYVYNNWGKSILMLLPRLDPDHGSEETKINNACMSIGEGTLEEEYAVDQWIEEYPHTPFLVSVGNPGDRGDISKCVEIMKEKIKGYNNDWNKFVDDSVEFDKWREVVYYVSNTDGAEQIVCHDSWKALIDKAFEGRNVNKNNPSNQSDLDLRIHLFIGADKIIIPLMKGFKRHNLDEDTVVRFNDYLKFRIGAPGVHKTFASIATDCSFISCLKEAMIKGDMFAVSSDRDRIYLISDAYPETHSDDFTSGVIKDFIKIENERNGVK